ncbi:MAG: archaemetzincin family Zn-dependent metalloprotease [Ignavibacteria bacterium]|nr:archaemetzincin family Zn-dependent metalloprotease [Ignavibacteria bacterium]
MSCIHLLPLGNADRGLVGRLRRPLSGVFETDVETVDMSFDLEPYYEEERGQYNSTEILLTLKEQFDPGQPRESPGGDSRYLAICAPDLFTPVLTFVFGEAEFKGRVAVVSYHRLRNELYGLPPAPEVLFRRLLKESVHELGHTYGLVHCRNPRCVMRLSSYAEEIDLKEPAFCTECSRLRSGKGRSAAGTSA